MVSLIGYDIAAWVLIKWLNATSSHRLPRMLVTIWHVRASEALAYIIINPAAACHGGEVGGAHRISEGTAHGE